MYNLSAKHDASSFNACIIPSKPFCKKAPEVTGLTLNNGILCHKGRPVDNPTTPLIAATNFVHVSWLHEIPKPVILYGHNCKSFDNPRLLKLLQSCRLVGAFSEKVLGFVDTLPLYKDKFPEYDSHKQEYLVSKCLEITYNAHNAIDDVQSLCALVKKSSPSMADHIKYSFAMENTVERPIYAAESERRKMSLEMLISNKVLTKSVAKRVAESGLGMKQLKIAHRRNAENGMKLLFTEKHEGKCRVTSSTRIIKAVSDFLQQI